MTDIRIESTVFRVSELKSDTPDACSGSKTIPAPLAAVEKGSNIKMTDISVKFVVFRAAVMKSDSRQW